MDTLTGTPSSLFAYDSVGIIFVGVVEILALYPLDGKWVVKTVLCTSCTNLLLVVIKTRAQLNSGASVGVVSSFREIIKTEG